MKKIVLILICSANVMVVKAQKHEFLNPPKFADADLSKTKSLLDENAPAEILYKSVHFMVDHTIGELHKNIFTGLKSMIKIKLKIG
ncbi:MULTISPECIES: hypothetical protein [unclassified Chryseobacterium]|uniref:hypothetical protein n=1 Tax=unclassified Chryseobacterium TaxID=2593645 RepID=UPI001E622537|nr:MULTISPECIES: hypothetical protein [unclassified Chryseobacterium]